MDALIAFFTRFVALSPDAEAATRSGFTRRKWKRGEFMLRAGEVANYAHFVESGGLRVYSVADGAEITIWLGLANSLVVSLPSFVGRKPSVEFIQHSTIRGCAPFTTTPCTGSTKPIPNWTGWVGC